MNEKYWNLVENLRYNQSTIQSKVNESVSLLAFSIAKKIVKHWIETRKTNKKKDEYVYIDYIDILINLESFIFRPPLDSNLVTYLSYNWDKIEGDIIFTMCLVLYPI